MMFGPAAQQDSLLLGLSAKHDPIMRGLDRYPIMLDPSVKHDPIMLGLSAQQTSAVVGPAEPGPAKFRSYFHKDPAAVGPAHNKTRCYWVLVIARLAAVGQNLQKELIKVGLCCHEAPVAMGPAASPNCQQDPLLLGIIVSRTQQQEA
jgi:hypothetical protein